MSFSPSPHLMVKESPLVENGGTTCHGTRVCSRVREDMNYTIDCHSPPSSFNSETCLWLSACFHELAMNSSSSAVDIITDPEAPNVPGRAGGSVGSRSLSVSDIAKNIRNEILESD